MQGFLLLTACLAGMNALSARSVEPDAAAVLQAVEQRRQQATEFQMPFAHTRVSTLFTKPQTRKGVLYFSPVHGLALAYTHPENYTILMQENQALMLDSNDVRRIQLSRHPFFKGMLSLFTEPFTNVRRYFDIPVCRSEDGVMHMELVPRRARGVTDITVELDEATGHMRRVEIQEESGDQQTIVFSPAMMQTVPDAYFTPAHWSPLGEAWMPVER